MWDYFIFIPLTYDLGLQNIDRIPCSQKVDPFVKQWIRCLTPLVASYDHLFQCLGAQIPDNSCFIPLLVVLNIWTVLPLNILIFRDSTPLFSVHHRFQQLLEFDVGGFILAIFLNFRMMTTSSSSFIWMNLFRPLTNLVLSSTLLLVFMALPVWQWLLGAVHWAPWSCLYIQKEIYPF